MAISLVASSYAGGHSGGGGATQSCSDAGAGGTINTAGASLLILWVTDYNFNSTTDTVSDSKGNTWHALNRQTNTSGTTNGCLFYAWDHGGSALSVGAGHDFSITGSYPAFVVLAFSGTKTSADPFDVQNGAGSTGSGAATLNSGSVTPSVAGSLVVAGCGGGTTSGDTVSSASNSYTLGANQVSYDGSTKMGSAVAYLLSASALTSTTFTKASNDDFVIGIAVFAPAPAGGGGRVSRPSNLSGIGGAGQQAFNPSLE